jgi:hypothetical protein
MTGIRGYHGHQGTRDRQIPREGLLGIAIFGIRAR